MDEQLKERIASALRRLRSDAPADRDAARGELVAIGSPAVRSVAALLGDEEVCGELLKVLAALGAAAAPAAPELLKVLVEHYGSDTGLAPEAARILEAIGEGTIAPACAALRGAADDDATPLQRLINRLPHGATVRTLAAALHDASGDYRLRLLETLALFRENAAPAAPVLLDLLHGTAGDVRLAASSALASVGAAAVPALVRLTGSEREEVAVAALRGLGECRRLHGHTFDLAAVELHALLVRSLSAPFPQVRVTAALELQHLTHDAAGVAIEATLAGPLAASELEAVVWRLAGEGLEHLVTPATLDRLQGLALHPSTRFDVRRAAGTVLLYARSRPYPSAILVDISRGLLDPEDPHTLEYLRAIAYGVQKNTILIPAVLPHLRFGHTDRCVAAVAALGTLGSARDDVLDSLEPLLNSRHHAIIFAVVDTLGKLAPASPRAVEMLVTQIHGPAKYQAVGQLGRLGTAAAAAVPALAAAVYRSETRSRGDDTGLYSRTLGEIATPEAVAELWRVLRFPPEDFWESMSARSALERLGHLPNSEGTAPGDNVPGTRPADGSSTAPQVTGETAPGDAAETAGGDHTHEL